MPLEIPKAPYQQTSETLAAELRVDLATGLSNEEAQQRLTDYGENTLPQGKTRSAYSYFFSQFKSILIQVLLAAALLAALIGNIKDAIVIACVVLINTSVGFFQEYRAEKSLAALKKMLPTATTVKRNGETIDLPAAQLVPGDIVLLEAGDKTPCDGRLIVAAGLEIDESSLTGESQPSAKQTDALDDLNPAVADQSNMVFMNTMLTRGRAEVLVTATGKQTEMGKLSAELSETEEPETPLQVELDKLGKILGSIAVGLVIIIAFFSWLRGTELSHIVLDAIALAVAAIPEGLPVVVTVTLALGMRNMARNNAIIKRMASAETLGCTTVICSDKTGTLTMNQMTVRAFTFQGEPYSVTGEGYALEGEIRYQDTLVEAHSIKEFIEPLVACNDSTLTKEGGFTGDPMEAALLVLGEKAGISKAQLEKNLPRKIEIPFDAQHKYMATIHEQDEEVLIYVKGAPDVLLAHCTSALRQGGEVTLQAKDRASINEHYHALANDGLRGLMIARRILPKSDFDSSKDLFSYIEQLTFLGLVGLQDPPRKEAKPAVEACHRAGIKVKMITGDHKATGVAIARELGLKGIAITGSELDALDEAELSEIIDRTDVFARVSPAHKLRIIRALRANNHVVAMTGDGVNDAPALKGADIGVAMGHNGTEVSKEAASMILVDDNFATIVKAIERGRTLYDNIVKFVRFQLATTIGAILTVFFAPLAGFPEPFSAVQILWVAIIMDGPPAISLALDSGRAGIMDEPPRPRAMSILPLSRLAVIFSYGLIMMIGTIGVLDYGMHTGDKALALTLAFNTFVLFQVFNVFNARNEFQSAFNPQFFSNKMLWLSLGVVIALQYTALEWEPARSIFGTSEISAEHWSLSIAVASAILLADEIRKQVAKLIVRRP